MRNGSETIICGAGRSCEDTCPLMLSGRECPGLREAFSLAGTWEALKPRSLARAQ